MSLWILTEQKTGFPDLSQALRLNVNVGNESPAAENGHVEGLLVGSLHSGDVHWDDPSLDYLEGSVHQTELFTARKDVQGEEGSLKYIFPLHNNETRPTHKSKSKPKQQSITSQPKIQNKNNQPNKYPKQYSQTKNKEYD